MLDVHAPHGPTHGWRDFLSHIAAIAICLLLALALEKLAEYIHERHQLREARRELDADLKIIQAARSHTEMGDRKLDYSVSFFAAKDGPWQAVRQGGSLVLMPYEELQTYSWFHGILGSLMDSMHAFETTLSIGAAIAASAAPEKLNEHDLNELAGKTMEAQGRLANFLMFLKIEEGGFEQLGQQTASQ